MNLFDYFVLNGSLLYFDMFWFGIVVHNMFYFVIALEIMDGIEFCEGSENIASGDFIFEVAIGGITEVVNNFY